MIKVLSPVQFSSVLASINIINGEINRAWILLQDCCFLEKINLGRVAFLALTHRGCGQLLRSNKEFSHMRLRLF